MPINLELIADMERMAMKCTIQHRVAVAFLGAALSTCAIAGHQLTPSQMDSVTAGSAKRPILSLDLAIQPWKVAVTLVCTVAACDNARNLITMDAADFQRLVSLRGRAKTVTARSTVKTVNTGGRAKTVTIVKHYVSSRP